MITETPSQLCKNYPQNSEVITNRQINLELCASSVSLSMSYYLDCDEVVLKHFAQYFLHQSHEERERAEKPVKLQNQQGDQIFLRDVEKPVRDGRENGLKAMECALHLGKV
ncbi:ferritin heavy chain-like [Molossus molossus]|uniref:ferritin heavy chain-like n=1 Tax=Molossus molossus TaxID=27622 RepID=UPI0017465593|nr:ferritin heavy chain-like [Molossus molossus]